MKLLECPSCKKMAVARDGRTGKVRCYARDCSWSSPSGFIVYCPVCHSDQIEAFTKGIATEGSYCKRYGTRSAFNHWNGEK